MDDITYTDKLICLLIAAVVIIVVAAAVVCIFYRRRTARILDNVGKMLDSAIDGSFEEHRFDESKLSYVEGRMAHYLAESSTSERNLNDEKNRIKELISDISHQTKTPVANILLYSQLLLEHELPDEQRMCAEALSVQADKLNFLIASLVKVSRLEAGIISVNPKPESINELLKRVSGQATPPATAKGIKLKVRYIENGKNADRHIFNCNSDIYENTEILQNVSEQKAGSEADISTEYINETIAVFDMKWTVEALYNIVDNAIKYSPKGSEIQITVEAYELFCRIDVADNGIGIAESELAQIFGRFYRSAAVSEQEGVGIGLFLSREILSAEGGYVKVASILGKGSTFSVFLPMKN